MDQLKMLLAAIAAAALLGGCAGSGGGGDTSADTSSTYAESTSGDGSSTQSTSTQENGRVDNVGELFLCLVLPVFCLLAVSTTVATGPSIAPPSAPVALVRWSDHRYDGTAPPAIFANGLQLEVRHGLGADGSMRDSSDAVPTEDATVVMRLGSTQGSRNFIWNFDASGAALQASAYTLSGRNGLEILIAPGKTSPSAFAGRVGVERIGIASNPHNAGWDYQSFGAWESRDGSGAAVVRAASFGVATPASAVPASGSASFTGTLGGLYVSPAGQGAIAMADVKLDVDFSARSVDFASSRTALLRAPTAPVAAPELDLRGRLTYAPGTNAFSGTLSSAGGTLQGGSSGRFYGPSAQEAGGAFALKSATSPEAFTGAYGAKR